MKNSHTAIASFEELAEHLKQAPSLELPSVESLDASALKKRAEETRANAGKIRQWTELVLPKLEEISSLGREEQESAEKTVAEARTKLASFLAHSTQAFRRAARLAYLLYKFRQSLDLREVIVLVEELVKQDYLAPRADDSKEKIFLEVAGRRYDFSAESHFGEEEKAEVEQSFREFVRRAWATQRRETQEKGALLRSRTETTFQEFLEGKAGKCTLEVPPEEVTNGEGKTIRLWGGTLQVELVEKKTRDGKTVKLIVPIDAAGGIEAQVKEIINAGAFLNFGYLGSGNPPQFDRTTFQKLGPEKAKGTRTLWHFIRRTKKAELEEKAREELHRNLASKATVAPEQFFLERQAGTCLAEFDGTWETKSPEGRVVGRIPNLFFLVARQEGEDGATIQLVAFPTHLEEFFKECKEAYPERNSKFEEVARPLKAVLQAIYGQLRRSSALEPKTE